MVYARIHGQEFGRANPFDGDHNESLSDHSEDRLIEFVATIERFSTELGGTPAGQADRHCRGSRGQELCRIVGASVRIAKAGIR